MQKGVPDLLVLSPFVCPWIATAVGCQSTHARLRSPRLLQGNQPPCLQKLLEPETTAGQPAPLRLQKFLDLFTEGNRPTRLLQDCPRLLQGNQPPRLQKQLKSWTTWDNQSHSNPDLSVY